MAFTTITFPAGDAHVAVPKPPAVPRKRQRVGRSRKASTPAYPLKPEGTAWTDAENEALREAVMQFGERKRDWPKVGRAMAVHGRDKEMCRKQWLTLRPPVKGSWTEEEDRLLATIVARQGPSGWSSIAKHIAGRNAKQCRERWVNHLNPNVNKSQWTEEEDKALVAAHEELGNKWSEIAKRLPGRPDNAVKNRWYTLKNRANGGGRKRQRARRQQPSLASLLAKHAKVDLEAVDETTLKTFNTLANRLSELASEQMRTGCDEAVPAAAPPAPTGAPTPSSEDVPVVARPPTKRRRSFLRRSLLNAAAAGVKTASLGTMDDTLEMSQMSMASDALREVGAQFSVDLEKSIGLESASFASELLTALEASLDFSMDLSLIAKAAEEEKKLRDARVPSPVMVPVSPASSEDRSAGTPSPPACPAPPNRPRRNGRRPSRVVTTFASQLLAPSPSVKPLPLVSTTHMPAEVLATVPVDALPLPLDEVSMNSLSISFADLSFFQNDDAPLAVAL